MLKIIEGSTEDVKKELQKLIKLKREEVTRLKKDLALNKKELSKFKKQHPAKKRTDEVDAEILHRETQIKRLEENIKKRSLERDQFIKRFNPSTIVPVRVGGIVVNYKIYEQMMKKLDRFEIKVEVTNDKLLLKYTRTDVEGTLELYDISDKLIGIKHVPIAVIGG